MITSKNHWKVYQTHERLFFISSQEGFIISGSWGVQDQSLRVATQPVFVSHTLETTFTEATGIPGKSYVDLNRNPGWIAAFTCDLCKSPTCSSHNQAEIYFQYIRTS